MPRGNIVSFKPGGTPSPNPPSGMPIAEPVHRIAPEGAGSGISMRDQPTSCVDQVRKICMHYVSKCSGKYDNSKVSARYVHQMASEVLTQLKGVAMQIKQQENNPEILQELLDEWNDQFPPSLGDLGTPKHIAATLQRQSKEVVELKSKLSEETKRREKDVGSVLRSMDAQLHASRDSVMTERRQHTMAHTHQLNQLKAQLKEAARAQRSEAKAKANASSADLVMCQNRYSDRINALEKEVAETRAQADVELAAARGRLAALEMSSKDKESSLKRTIKKLQLDVAHSSKPGRAGTRGGGYGGGSYLRGQRSISSNDGSRGLGMAGGLGMGGAEDDVLGIPTMDDDGNASAGGRSKPTVSSAGHNSLPSTVEQDEKEMEEDVSDVSSVMSIPIVMPAKKAVDGAPRKDHGRTGFSTPVVNIKNVRVRGGGAMAGIKILKRELRDTMEVSAKQEVELQQLRTDLIKYIADVQFQKKRADGLDSINDSLRSALSDVTGHREHGDTNHNIHGSVLRFAPQVLKHTPHFLGDGKKR